MKSSETNNGYLNQDFVLEEPEPAAQYGKKSHSTEAVLVPESSGCFYKVHGTRKKLSEQAIIKAAEEIAAARLNRKGLALTSPELAVEHLRQMIGFQERECFVVVFLDNQHQIISTETMFYGTIDSASVHPREVVKRGLALNCAAALVAHNHPSGNLEPSQSDEHLTRKLKDALGIVDIRLLDHFVVSPVGHISLAERGLM